jgi:HPt (histidine-containing phosphotransfer) domain-containing protein
MDSTGPAHVPPTPDLSAALDRLWVRFLPEIEQRVALLESAAAAAAGGTLTPPQQQQARAAAHKLAGVLASFGLATATSPARETEHLYARDTAPGPEHASRLAAFAAELRSLIAGRKPSAPEAC